MRCRAIKLRDTETDRTAREDMIFRMGVKSKAAAAIIVLLLLLGSLWLREYFSF